MKLKILVAGNNASRNKFFLSLGQYFKFDQAGASINSLGTGTYKFRLENCDIELFYLEDHVALQKNYKKYGKGSTGIIFLDADSETITKLRAACGHDVAYVSHNGGNINAIKGLKVLFKRMQEQKDAADRAKHALFQASVLHVQVSVPDDHSKNHGPAGP